MSYGKGAAGVDPGNDDYDVFVVDLQARSLLIAETGGDEGCPGDTMLFRIDAAVLENDGIELAVAEALAQNDDIGFGQLCSRLVEALDPGMHYYAVTYFPGAAPQAFDYTLRLDAVPLVADGGRCDAASYEDLCDVGGACEDEDEDGDGVCVVGEE